MNEKILRKMFIIDKIMFSNCIYIIIHIYWNEKLSTFLGELSFSFKSFKSLKKYIIWFIFGLYLVYIWFIFGLYLVYIWFLFGLYLVYIWFIFGLSFCIFRNKSKFQYINLLLIHP